MHGIPYQHARFGEIFSELNSNIPIADTYKIKSARHNVDIYIYNGNEIVINYSILTYICKLFSVEPSIFKRLKHLIQVHYRTIITNQM